MPARMKTTEVAPGGADGFRSAAIVVVTTAAIVSAVLTFYAGRRNPSTLLVAVFALWVVSPFAAFAVAHAISSRWSASARKAMSLAMIGVAAVSVAIYAAMAAELLRMKLGAVFLVVPAASWLVVLAASAPGLWSGRGARG